MLSGINPITSKILSTKFTMNLRYCCCCLFIYLMCRRSIFFTFSHVGLPYEVGESVVIENSFYFEFPIEHFFFYSESKNFCLFT